MYGVDSKRLSAIKNGENANSYDLRELEAARVAFLKACFDGEPLHRISALAGDVRRRSRRLKIAFPGLDSEDYRGTLSYLSAENRRTHR